MPRAKVFLLGAFVCGLIAVAGTVILKVIGLLDVSPMKQERVRERLRARRAAA